MRPVGKRRLQRCEVAAKPMTAPGVPVSNLLASSDQLNEIIDDAETSGVSTLRVMIPSDWDESASSGGSGGCRNVPFAPEPFSGAA